MAAGRSDRGRRSEPLAARPVVSAGSVIHFRALALLLLLAPLGAAAQDDWRGYRDALARGDYNAVAAELRPLADRGDPEAQYRYAMLHAEGLGVRSNDALAASWLRRAADQGHPLALMTLGNFYRDGRGVPADPATALQLYRKAADGGYAPAAHLLRQMRSGK